MSIIYKKCFDADMKYSKLYKFIKDPNQFQELKDIMLKNYDIIFEWYLYA
jgi:hypothetical protein